MNREHYSHQYWPSIELEDYDLYNDLGVMLFNLFGVTNSDDEIFFI